MRAHAVHLGTPFATSFQAAAFTLTSAGAEEAMAKKIKIPISKTTKQPVSVDMPLAALGFTSALKAEPVIAAAPQPPAAAPEAAPPAAGPAPEPSRTIGDVLELDRLGVQVVSAKEG